MFQRRAGCFLLGVVVETLEAVWHRGGVHGEGDVGDDQRKTRASGHVPLLLPQVGQGRVLLAPQVVSAVRITACLVCEPANAGELGTFAQPQDGRSDQQEGDVLEVARFEVVQKSVTFVCWETEGGLMIWSRSETWHFCLLTNRGWFDLKSFRNVTPLSVDKQGVA